MPSRPIVLLPLLLLAAVMEAICGPLEFGLAELQRAIADRGLRPLRLRTEVTAEAPESWRIESNRITGGDLRGLMYGLLAAAEQIRTRGYLVAARGKPATSMRGIRIFLHNEDLEKDWYYSPDYWREFFAMLARNRFNRINLVFAHQTPYLAPPYPYWVDLPEFPRIRVPGLTDGERRRNFEMLRFISQTAAEHAIDFTLGIWEHNVQAGMKPSVEGLTRENIGPYSYAALKKVLAECPAIRSVQMRTNSESGIPPDRQVEFYRDWVWRAIAEAGRRVTLDLRGWAMQKGMMEAAENAGVPLRLSSKYWAEDLGRPYQPAETWPGYSFLNFLRKPRAYDFYWEVWGLGSHRLLLWGDPDYVRRIVGTFHLSGSTGFEIDPPLAQKGFGNRPGTWGVFTEANRDRVFWKHEFERYWLFYLLWGRLSYDPATSERVWLAELERRFGKAAGDAMEAYRNSSRVLSEIVAVHLADPNMYIWPEINPGGLIDSYREVAPSDWRLVASFDEAARNRLERTASAKQTPLETATRLHELALATEQALARAAKLVTGDNREWRGSEPDFRVLAAMGRYHGRKQMAADHLTWFYRTSDSGGLYGARRELTGSLVVWERLVKLTDGLYPEEMAFGPDDIGHWKHKLPYVRHDLKMVEERLKVFERFGRFDFGFDFGGPPAAPRGGAYRNLSYVLGNTVEPRFQLVEPATGYQESRGFGWASQGRREAVALMPSPYAEVRAVARDPRRLPENALLGDSIRGQGPQTFRVRTGDGAFTALLLFPDGTTGTRALTARQGHVDVVFPEGEWNVSGLVLTSDQARTEPPPRTWTRLPARPAMTHTPPKIVLAGQPLVLSLRVWPIPPVHTVRLHYRPLNQLAKFKTLEASSAKAVFTIPGEDLSPEWDLMYYFEVLTREGGGWVEADPAVATPYHVVEVAAARGENSP